MFFICSVKSSCSKQRRSECSGSCWNFELRIAVWWMKLVSDFASRPRVSFRFVVLSSYSVLPFAEQHAAELAKSREGYVLKRVADERAGELIQFQQETAEELVVVKIK